MACPANAADYARFRFKLRSVLQVLAHGLPQAKMFIASQLGMPTTEWQTYTPAQRRQFGGTGPCDYLNPQGKVVPPKIIRLVHILRGYEAQVRKRSAMRRPLDLGGTGRWMLLVVAAAAVLLSAAQRASAATLKVCKSGCPYTELAPAVAAAPNGDKIELGPGTYAGGVTINLSVKLVGTSADKTIIRGGGPVLTIGAADAPSEPTVTIRGVTVTGGVTIGNLAPESGRGGGIYIPRAAGPSTGATVTIRDSVIRGNNVAPRVAIESEDPCCPFADSGGGGISNDGTLTVADTQVSDNRGDPAAGLASNAIGGGILNRAFGRLMVKHSVVTHNHVIVTPPNGRFAAGAGTAASGGTLAITAAG